MPKRFFTASTASIKFNRNKNTKVHGESFGCNRRATCEKTQTSEEKTASEEFEKKKSLVMGVGWGSKETGKTETRKILSKMRFN